MRVRPLPMVLGKGADGRWGHRPSAFRYWTWLSAVPVVIDPALLGVLRKYGRHFPMFEHEFRAALCERLQLEDDDEVMVRGPFVLLGKPGSHAALARQEVDVHPVCIPIMISECTTGFYGDLRLRSGEIRLGLGVHQEFVDGQRRRVQGHLLLESGGLGRHVGSIGWMNGKRHG